MARLESDREDLIREATALVPRLAIALPTCSEVVLGLRKPEALSLYWDGDPVYHFNSQRELRRAFVEGKLFKAEDGELIESTRERTDTATMLHSKTLALPMQLAFLEKCRRVVGEVESALTAYNYSLLAQVPQTEEVLPRFHKLLKDLSSHPIKLATSPRCA